MNFNVITYICTFVAGVAFIIAHGHSDFMLTLTRLTGLIFLLPGVINFMQWLKTTKGVEKQRLAARGIGMMLVCLGAVILGVFMLFMPETFQNYVAFTFGALLIVCAVMQVLLLVGDVARYKSQYWFMLVPVLMVVAGVVLMILQAEGVTSTQLLLTGVVLIAYSLNGFTAQMVHYFRHRGDAQLQQALPQGQGSDDDSSKKNIEEK